ncbi:MAG: 16S rRNA (guanine(966)-N(2))-methyltransferase RsmD [Firmicutes bacterium]|nr:16S rRNA (guanine(966)-N(2))-methyltransferase RsmD [Bacillota bacterium]
MRVIAGSAGVLRLQTVKGTGTRPTADRVKESLFSILGPQIAGARVLDLFAGSGSLGIEALSRGAQHAVFVDRMPACIEVIRANLNHTGLASRGDVVRADALSYLERLAREGRQFDVIFADPPYGRRLAAETLARLARTDLLTPSGRLVIEHSCKEEMQDEAKNLTLVRRSEYGDTCVSFYGTPKPAS